LSSDHDLIGNPSEMRFSSGVVVMPAALTPAISSAARQGHGHRAGAAWQDHLSGADRHIVGDRDPLQEDRVGSFVPADMNKQSAEFLDGRAAATVVLEVSYMELIANAEQFP
jgi:hypothetical protein